MTENGFSYMGHSLQHALRRLMDSPLISSFRGKRSNQVKVNQAFSMLDAEVSKVLSEMAVQDLQTKIALWQQLTKREREVAALACQGMTNPQIAETLHISRETVKKHISSILHKFQIKGREILRWMLEGWNFDHPQAPWGG
ncbi:MAG: LuxR family transcriptional regulator [Chloroflexota bacterium]